MKKLKKNMGGGNVTYADRESHCQEQSLLKQHQQLQYWTMSWLLYPWRSWGKFG